MKLTNKQEQGLRIAVERYKNHEPWTCIAGYAGSGKSTLISFIIDALGLDSSKDVCYITFTGKAALVLRNKGCSNAMTAHKLLYDTRINQETGEMINIPYDTIHPYKLIVVDEVSMLPLTLWNLLLQHKRPIIALGDPGQLDPIGEDNGVLKNPHIFLDEIMRQAQDSEIIRLSMAIREGKPLRAFQGDQVRVYPLKDWSLGMCQWADQIIVGKNATRQNTNDVVRHQLLQIPNHINYPVQGEKIICLQNIWDKPNESGDVLVNGTIGHVTNIHFDYQNKKLQPRMKADFLPDYYDDYDVEISPQDLFFRQRQMDFKLFTEHQPTVTKDNWSSFPKYLRPIEFDYGYCITCHKAQGSEYDKVLVKAERLGGGAAQYKKWLYTACTRAKEKLVVIQEY